jgi:hypothetical protein
MFAHSLTRLVLFPCAALGAGAAAFAQWPTNPATNLAIGDKPGAQVLPKIASTSDGGTYITWFDQAPGNYDVYLQRLDAQGHELWPHDGILISNNTQLSSLVDWDMIADANDCAVIAFTDARQGGDLDVYAYRVDPTGQMLWGANGIALSNNADFEANPHIAQTTDGGFVFVWSLTPNTGQGSIRVQKLTATGAPVYQQDGFPIVGTATEKPGFATVVAADNNAYVVMWVRDIATFASPRHIRAQKFDAGGNALWGASPVVVYDAASVPIGYQPILQKDGAGGALFCWHSATGNLFDSYVQHVSAAGAEIFPHNGVKASTEANRNKLNPTLAFVASTGEMIVTFEKEDSNQSQWGITTQKVSPSGAVQWGANGIDLLPLSGIDKSAPRSVPQGTGAEIFFFDMPNTPSMQARAVGMRIDNSGAQVWSGAPIVIASTLSDKDKLVVTLDTTGVAKLAWHDDRNDPANDVYAQNVNPDGTLGFQDNCATLEYCTAAPNSLGFGSTISATGSTSIAANTFTLNAAGSPPHVNGFFFYGSHATEVPLGDGFRCVAGSVFRLGPALQTNPSGQVSRLVNFSVPPAGSGPGQINPGSTWYFQWYYRNVGGPLGSNYNLSDALRADFCP